MNDNILRFDVAGLDIPTLKSSFSTNFDCSIVAKDLLSKLRGKVAADHFLVEHGYLPFDQKMDTSKRIETIFKFFDKGLYVDDRPMYIEQRCLFEGLMAEQRAFKGTDSDGHHWRRGDAFYTQLKSLADEMEKECMESMFYKLDDASLTVAMDLVLKQTKEHYQHTKNVVCDRIVNMIENGMHIKEILINCEDMGNLVPSEKSDLKWTGAHKSLTDAIPYYPGSLDKCNRLTAPSISVLTEHKNSFFSIDFKDSANRVAVQVDIGNGGFDASSLDEFLKERKMVQSQKDDLDLGI